jgi:beta-aspartyl-dipeptidase (metallo-type)
VTSALTLFRDADVYAPEHLGRRDVLTGGGAVLAIAAKLPELALPGCEVVELGGARLVPGLLDAHVHLTGGGGESGPSSRVPPVQLGALARAGITTAIGVLGTDGTTRSVASLVAATLGLREEGLSAFCWTGSYEVPPITLTGTVRGDLAFVDPILGVGEVAISDHRSSQPTFDELVRLAADCHVGGLMSGKAGLLHLHVGDGPRGLELVRRALDTTELPARVFYPTHVNRKTRLFDEALDLARRGCTVDVTAFPVDDGEDAYSAADAIARYLASDAPRHLVTVSSDGGGCLPTFDGDGRLIAMDVGKPSAIAETLQILLSRGHALADVLPVFTRNVAHVLRLATKGKVEVGADADLVVLDDAHRIREVMACGRFVVRGGASVVLGTFERAPSKANP